MTDGSFSHPVVIRPALHDGTAPQRRVNVPADSFARLAAEPAIHQVAEIVLPRRALQYVLVTHIEKRTWAGLGTGQVLLLIIRKAFLVDHCDLAFVLHMVLTALQLLTVFHKDSSTVSWG